MEIEYAGWTGPFQSVRVDVQRMIGLWLVSFGRLAITNTTAINRLKYHVRVKFCDLFHADAVTKIFQKQNYSSLTVNTFGE